MTIREAVSLRENPAPDGGIGTGRSLAARKLRRPLIKIFSRILAGLSVHELD
jgi:hypothetical protein